MNVPLDDETRFILGMPSYRSAGFAAGLRCRGREIGHRAEDEQAAVIHWMLNLYLEHGPSWREEAALQLAPAQPQDTG